MRKIVHKHKYRSNRKMVFENDTLQLWLDTRESHGGAPPVAVLKLKQRRPGTRTRWDLCWLGTVKIEQWGATVETLKPGAG